MGAMISKRSPAMAYSNGGLWVSTYDEMGRRCWINNLTGERTYRFIDGNPVSPMADPMVSPYPMQSPSTMPYMTTPNPAATFNNGNVAPWAFGGHGNGQMVPYQQHQGSAYGTGVPPVTPGGNSLSDRVRRYYLRPASEPKSWMWR